MPRARRSAARGSSMADARCDSTATGLSVWSTSRPSAFGNDSSPSYSGTRSTASATTSTLGSSARAVRHCDSRSSVSAPEPQTSSGLVGSSPGSSSPASRSVVGSDRGANGTPRRSATSAASTRSAPESCTVAMPPARRRTRRPMANDSRLSASSPRSSTRCTPYAENSASQAASDPAIAPECASTSVRPRDEVPTVSATTGTSRDAASASTARMVSASRSVSSTSPTTFVSGSESA